MLNALPNFHSQNMIKYFQPQGQTSLSGPASLALLITSINVAYRIYLSEYRYDTPEFNAVLQALLSGEILEMSTNDFMNTNIMKKYLASINIDRDGLTLQQLRSMANLLKFGVNTYYVDDGSVRLDDDKRNELKNLLQGSGDQMQFKSLEDFRNKLNNFFDRSTALPAGLIVNYDRSVLGHNGQFGHFSPVAAYDKKNDRVLVMDMEAPAWVRTDLLYKAMATVDGKSGLPCGMIHVYELLV